MRLLSLFIFSIVASCGLMSRVEAQCAYTGFADFCADLDASTFTVGVPNSLCETTWGGEHDQVNNMTGGCTYRVETCGTTYDSEVTVFADGGGTALAFSGSGCGDDVSLDFVPSSDGNYEFQVTQNGCVVNSGPLTAWAITLISCPSPSVPEIDIEGNSTSIADGDATPALADDTDFGSFAAGASGSTTFTVQNEGTGDLTLSGGPAYATLSGSSLFSVTSQPAGTISASGSSTFTILFNASCPVSTGTYTATVSVSSDDADESPYTFSIRANVTGTDTDGDGLLNNCDSDDDNDGIADASDPDDADFNICGDSDGDGCDDCSVTNDGFGALSDSDPFNDGADADCDGICDSSDGVFDDPLNQRGNMLTLNGSNYVAIGNVSALDFDRNEAFSIECWVRSGLTSDQIIFAKLSASPQHRGYSAAITGTELNFYLGNDEPAKNFLEVETTSSPITLNNWHHIVFTYDGSSAASGVTLYVDGVSQPLTTLRNTLSATTINSSSAYIGVASPLIAPFVGDMDELRIWNVERSQTQIRENRHLSFAGGCSNPVTAYYKFNEPSGSTVTDLSPNGNDGTMVNSPVRSLSEAHVSAGVSTTHSMTATGVGYTSAGSLTDHALTLTFASTAPGGEVVVTFLEEGPVGGDPAGALAHTRDELWIVNNYGPTNAGLDGTARFSYPDYFITSVSLASYNLHKRGSNSIGAWTLNNSFATAASTVLGSNYIEFNNLTDFSMLYPSSDISSLPINQIELNVHQSNAYTATLTWKHVYNEAAKSVLEKSDDGLHWKTIYTTHSIEGEQHFVDQDIWDKQYYRVRVMAKGQTHFSEIKELRRSGSDVTVYPNPSQGWVNVSLTTQEEAQVVVTDATGKVVREIRLTPDNKGSKVFLETRGVYLFKVQTAGSTSVEKVIIH